MEDPGPTIVALLAGATTILFSMAEAAVRHHSGPKLMDLARQKGSEGWVPAFLKDEVRYLIACHTAALIAQVAFVLAVLYWVGETGSRGLTGLRAGLVAVAALLTLGRILPIFLGRLFAEPVLIRLRPVILAADFLLRPALMLIHGQRRFLERLAGRPMVRDGHDQVQEDILSAVEEGELEGALAEDEAAMIERALSLRDADVADSMTPRTRMFALAIATPLGEAVKLLSEAGHSRVPVYRKDLDEIVGILYAKDVLKLWSTPEASQASLARIARKPFFVPETKRVSQLLDEFKASQTHMAIVLDEYGGTAGLITIEDILEEIVGDIEDEFDPAVDVPLLMMIGPGEAEVDAQVHVDDLADALDVEIESDDYDTVGGMCFAVLGRVPSPGDEFDFAGLHVTVLDANDRSVNRVRAVRSG